MALNILNNHQIEPVYNNFKKIDFNNDILNTLLISISNNVMVFTVSIIDNLIEEIIKTINGFK